MAEQQWTLLDPKVTIVNRKKSYEISKQKLSSIPYFVKLFADSDCDTTKIELDLDKNSFDNIVDFIVNNHLSISMENAFSMMEIADYLEMDDIKQKYYDCIVSNFNIKLLGEFLDFYKNREYPENFTENKVKSFIEKYFVPISNTRAFLKFPVALIERILKMNLVVSYEYQIVEAIDRWVKFNEQDRKQHLPHLMKFVNFCHLTEKEITRAVFKETKNFTGILANFGFHFHTQQLKEHSPHACQPEFCQSDCKSNRHSYKSLVSIYELGEDEIEIRRLSRSNNWTKSYQFTRDETMSTSLIEAGHIVDIIYDSGRKGIRIDWNTKKFRYMKMFGGDDSYYGQVYKYFAHDICTDSTHFKISNALTASSNKRFNIKRVESLSLSDKLEGICYLDGYSSDCHGVGVNRSSSPQYYFPSLDYRKLSSCEFEGPTQARSCLSSNLSSDSKSQKVLYNLTQQDFSRYSLRGEPRNKGPMIEIRSPFVVGHGNGTDVSIALDYSFLKDFIGSDSLDHIELISHDNNMLIVNKETKMIYSYIEETDHWQFMTKIESSGKMIAIAFVYFPIGSE
ncbi:uncharacterized protein LOC128387952 [Panonychus citri]|uniref:uncharacterized protein LOC128387952 n=1 Tax=Panonychus citri TaxID=50023 RepID=UPI002306E886|nr:uncharacterized protein LOC128387952 [Panonychus citri]